jgi:hypothetical protein
VNIGTKGDVFVLTEEQRREMQDINRAQILRWKEHPEEWDKYLEDNKRDPRRVEFDPNSAKELHVDLGKSEDAGATQ